MRRLVISFVLAMSVLTLASTPVAADGPCCHLSAQKG